MTTAFSKAHADDTRRDRLYAGQVFVNSASPASPGLSRRSAAEHIHTDTRPQPRPGATDLERMPEELALEYEAQALAVIG